MSVRPNISTISTDTLVDTDRALPPSVARTLTESRLLHKKETPQTIAEILLRREALLLPAVSRYVGYLKLIGETASAVAELYDLRSPPNSKGKKEDLRHTGPEDIFQIANYLYVLHDTGVEGSVLECGTSHGYSTCCLSHACARLNRHLFGADSFQGLPPEAADESFFRPGDYASPKETVMENLRTFGVPSCVTLLEGWFSESLKEWNTPVALLWLDVDLYDSARDVMKHISPHLQRQSAILLHEFTDFHNRLPDREAKRPPNAVFDTLESVNQPCEGIHIHRYFGAIIFPESPAVDSFAVAAAMWPRLSRLDTRWRSYYELRHSRTVRWLFAMKRIILGR